MHQPENTTSLDDRYQRLFELRSEHSKTRLGSLISSFEKSPEIGKLDGICVFCAGSYARLEASEHSDIDLFFVSKKSRSSYGESYNVPIIRMMSEVVRIGDELGFPRFSNDGQYLKILHLEHMLNTLGGHEDDYSNNFTARLLMLLESKPIFNESVYLEIIDQIVDSYYRDYPTHKDEFRPNFLINDITRFWKTLCLNYENKRNQRDVAEEKRIKQKIRNFKLKFSRLSTCFSSIAYLTALDIPVSKSSVIEMVGMTPSARLRSVAKMVPETSGSINAALTAYHWFLERTGTSESDLFAFFADEQRRTDAFGKASSFGDHMFDVLRQVDGRANSFRFLVI